MFRKTSNHLTEFRAGDEKGLLMIEAMIAISVVTVGLVSVLTLLSRSISINRVVADQYTAANLAAEGIEIVKNITDSNVIQGRPWNEGISSGSYEVDYSSSALALNQNRYLLFDSASGAFGYGAGASTKYRREIIIGNIGADETQINSVVNWTTRGGGSFSVNVEDHFFNWRP